MFAQTVCMPECGDLVSGVLGCVCGTVHVCMFQRPSVIHLLCSTCVSVTCVYSGVCVCVCMCVQAPFCVPVRKSPLVFVCVVSVAGMSFVSSYGGVKCGCLCRRPSENAVCVSACVCVCVCVCVCLCLVEAHFVCL